MSGTSNKPHTIDHNISLHHGNLIETHSTKIPPPLAASLNLSPHPEGGWFRETWIAPQKFHPEGYPALRAAASAIYFVLAPGEISMWHKLRSDELWIWQRGSPLQLFLGDRNERPSISPTLIRLGPFFETGEVPQAIVPGGVWQMARAGNGETLVSCIVVPGFDYDDFRVLDH
ncbi:hypothetical protein BGX23_004996 [Mortierella sp. AD031]|nr:hypothetical protein BGX23_004996 [Mortierella sp. AD031]KAG0195560.1 hypothetical protein BGX33_003049 [Mortierella sp. NVP41]